MDISAGLIAKTLGALAAASAIGSGAWWMLESEDEVKSNKITRYDKALIDFLHAGGKIQFAVLDSSNNDLNEFPKGFSDTTAKTITVKIKVNENDGDATKEGKLENKPNPEEGSKGKRDHLKAINKDNYGWTWSCEMTFVKKNSADTPTELDPSQSDKILKAGNGGLLGKLKKEIAGSDNKETKKPKKEFIRKCGHERGEEENKKINDSQEKRDEIKSGDTKKIKFELVKGGDAKIGTDVNKLFFSNSKEFKRWFSEG